MRGVPRYKAVGIIHYALLVVFFCLKRGITDSAVQGNTRTAGDPPESANALSLISFESLFTISSPALHLPTNNNPNSKHSLHIPSTTASHLQRHMKYAKVD